MPQRLPATKTPRRFPRRSFCVGRGFPTLCWSACVGRGSPHLCRSGVEPPTGTIHPRESSGTESRKQKSKIHFGMFLRIWNRRRIFSGGGAFRSGVQLYAGRGLNPRPERSTHAKAGEQSPENRNQRFISGCFSGFGIGGGYLAGAQNHPRKKTSKKRRNPPAKRYNVVNGRSQREKVRKKFRVRPPSNPTENFKGGIPP